MDDKRIIIAGPCAAESEEQIMIAIREAKKRGVDYMRVNLWKPRTKPGFEGLGTAGLSLLVTVTRSGVNPGLEVITAGQAQEVLDQVLPELGADRKVLLWVGARNQNHVVQKDIARVCMQDRRVSLMVKNQPWVNEAHWEGIVEHVLDAGLSSDRLLICHRGFAPTGDNPLGLRNVADFAMMARVRERFGLPMIFDPSHMGGNVANVYKVCKSAVGTAIDGLMVEVHHDPAHAMTDSLQQVTWPQFDELMQMFDSEQQPAEAPGARKAQMQV